MNKKSIFLMIISFILFTVILVSVREFIESRPIYKFESKEDEQYFRQIIGKPEGKIVKEDLKRYLRNYYAIYDYIHNIKIEDNKVILDRNEDDIAKYQDSIKRNIEFALYIYHKGGYSEGSLTAKDIEAVVNSMERLPQDDFVADYADWYIGKGREWAKYQAERLRYAIEFSKFKDSAFPTLTMDQIIELDKYADEHPDIFKGTNYNSTAE